MYQKPKTSVPNPEHKHYPYLLRDLTIDRSNQASFYWRCRGCLRVRASCCVPRFDVLKRILALGFPPFLTEVSFSVFFILFNRSMNTYGGLIAERAISMTLFTRLAVFLDFSI